MKNKFLFARGKLRCKILIFTVLVLGWGIPAVFAEPLHSPNWGFSMDLPDEYSFVEGNGKDRFSFSGPNGAAFDLLVYSGAFNTIKDLADDVNRGLENRGETSFFEYNGKSAALIELVFKNFAGWGFCVELTVKDGTTPMLLALSYGPAGKDELNLLHMSALDSIIPSESERRYPGPIIEYAFPRGEQKLNSLAIPGVNAMIYENDAEAAQALVEREFSILQRHLFSENWQNAWIRYYRIIYRDSWDRISDAAFQLERYWNVNITGPKAEIAPNTDNPNRVFAQKALTWVQGFNYERDLSGSDFINLVTAVTEGRGDCDSRAMLWAIILARTNINAAIMVSRNHSHAMGLADITGTGARFEANGTRWLVAETTTAVDIGLIAQDVSDIESWLGIVFEK